MTSCRHWRVLSVTWTRWSRWVYLVRSPTCQSFSTVSHRNIFVVCLHQTGWSELTTWVASLVAPLMFILSFCGGRVYSEHCMTGMPHHVIRNITRHQIKPVTVKDTDCHEQPSTLPTQSVTDKHTKKLKSPCTQSRSHLAACGVTRSPAMYHSINCITTSNFVFTCNEIHWVKKVFFNWQDYVLFNKI